MAFKIIIFTTFLAFARGGIIGAPLAAPLAPALAYHQTYAAPSLAVAHPAPFAYAAPVAKFAAPLSYAAPVAKLAAPLTYAAPVAKLAAPLAYAAPIAKVAAPVAKAVVNEEFDPNPQYSFGYQVEDSLTGDSKSQSETRNGDVVQGSYSLNDPDGTRRTVDYTADPINGFNAVVRKEPLVAKAAVVAAAPVAKVATPIVQHAPLYHAAPAPFTYAAPAVAKFAAPLTYAAPVAKLAAPVSYSTSLIH